MGAVSSAVASLGDLSRSAFLDSVKTAIRLLQINGDSRRQPRIAASDSSWGSLHHGDPRMLACMARDGRYIHPKRLPKTMR
jgi:hypothetical protein